MAIVKHVECVNPYVRPRQKGLEMFQTLAKYMHFPEKEVNVILAGSVSAHKWDGEDVEAAKLTASLFRKTEKGPATCQSEDLFCGTPEQHPPEQHSGDEDNSFDQKFSIYSDPQKDGWKLNAADWVRMSVEGGAQMDMTAEETTYFHGTTVWVAWRILVLGEAFIVGPGGHRVRQKTLKGMWLTPTLAAAWSRADPFRCLDEEERPTAFSCPCVMEVKTGTVKRVPGTEKFCKIGVPGHPIEGVRIVALHFNKAACQNWARFAKPDFRARALGDVTGQRRLCKEVVCGNVSNPDDEEDFATWQRSNKTAGWRCAECHKQRTNTTRVLEYKSARQFP